MIVITDSNLLFSALYTPNGVVATILKNEKGIQFIAPDFIFEEIKNHLPEIAEYTAKSRRQLFSELHELTSRDNILSCK
jgi:predicted nucleic acid-binding protein